VKEYVSHYWLNELLKLWRECRHLNGHAELLWVCEGVTLTASIEGGSSMEILVHDISVDSAIESDLVSAAGQISPQVSLSTNPI
jgi:hypothetical protein